MTWFHRADVLFQKKRGSRSKARPAIETGTQNKGDVDYDWLPKETLNGLSESGQLVGMFVSRCDGQIQHVNLKS